MHVLIYDFRFLFCTKLSVCCVLKIVNCLQRIQNTSFYPFRDFKPGNGIGNRPPSAKPKDPSELNIEDPELANDYRKMYERFTEMEAKMALLLQKDVPEKDIPDSGDR